MTAKHTDLTEAIIGAAIEVHRTIGPGLLESAYQTCLAREFDLRSIPFRREVGLPVEYKGVTADAAYRLDFLVDEKVIVEVKAANRIEPIFEAQLLTYLRLANRAVGLLINFHVPVLSKGIKRLSL